MSKGKLQKFAEMDTFPNVFQYPYSVAIQKDFPMKGKWGELYFGNSNPITLELGCGKGEYTVGLAKLYPERNFIGVDIKGARMYTGACQALNEELTNVAFLRTNIEIIDRFFSANEVEEIWLTFSDPQMKNINKRLTSVFFLNRYSKFLKNDGFVHLKTDSNFLFTYTKAMVQTNDLPLEFETEDLYGDGGNDGAATTLQTYYESMWLERGLNIRYICFHLPHDIRLQEPNIEIPLDEYRSYKRTKRSSLTVTK